MASRRRESWVPESELVGVETESRAEQIRRMFSEQSQDQGGKRPVSTPSSTPAPAPVAVQTPVAAKTVTSEAPHPLTSVKASSQVFESGAKATPTEPAIRRRAATLGRSAVPPTVAVGSPTPPKKRPTASAAAPKTPAKTISAGTAAAAPPVDFDTKAESIASMFGGSIRSTTTTPRKPSAQSLFAASPRPSSGGGGGGGADAASSVHASSSNPRLQQAAQPPATDEWQAESDQYDTKAEFLASRFGGRMGSNVSAHSAARARTPPSPESRADADLDDGMRSSIGAQRLRMQAMESTPEKVPEIRRRSVSDAADNEPAAAGGAAETPTGGATTPLRGSHLSKRAATTPATPSGADTAFRSRAATGFTPARGDKCNVCNETVYFSEKTSADNIVFHKKCFRCAQCNKILSVGTYAALEGQMFCKPCFKKNFKLSGNYATGFGKEQHKMKWSRSNTISH
eukprot:m.183137 g.183137  ORF g.183137 m.183137 type:complete len:457 (-) comp15731_c0_seq1:249-1619(-)